MLSELLLQATCELPNEPLDEASILNMVKDLVSESLEELVVLSMMHLFKVCAAWHSVLCALRAALHWSKPFFCG